MTLVTYAAPQAHAQETCRMVSVVFARGSGQKINKSDELNRFFDQLRKRIPNDTTTYYELGDTAHGGKKYPAVDVNPISHLDNLLGAWTSSGYANDYGASVVEGDEELLNYLSETSHCNSRIILAGYSQGAQVIGQTLRGLSDSIRNRIDFVALFGDPKLNLPEGRGFNPPACRGDDYSPWRRTIGDCNTDNGSLGARNPYLLADMESKTGLWCLNDDFVCGSSKVFFVNSGHMRYAEEDGSIDAAVQEIATKLSIQLPDAKIDTAFDITTPHTGGPDVMILLDDSARTENDGAYARSISRITSIIQTVSEQGGRTGIQTYTDFDGCGPLEGGGVTIGYDLGGLTEETLHHIQALKGSYLPPACGFSHSLRGAIGMAKNHSPWRQGVQKLIIVITKGPQSGIPPIEVDDQGEGVGISLSAAKVHGMRLASLASTDPSDVTIQVIGGDDIQQLFEDAEVDGERIEVIGDSEIARSINEHTQPALHAPQLLAQLRSTDYQAEPGDQLTFDASNTIAYNDSIILYEWDFDGDDTFEQQRHSPTTQYVYDADFNGEASVRITTQSGLTDTATAHVKIGNIAPTQAPAAAQRLAVRWGENNSAHLSWQKADTLANRWLVLLNDFPLGYVARDQLFLNVADMQPNQDNTFTVQAVTADETRSRAATVTLKKRSLAPTATAQLALQAARSQVPAGNQPVAFATPTSVFATQFNKVPTDSIASSTHANPFSKMDKTASHLLAWIIGGAFVVSLGVIGRYTYRRKRL